MWDEKYGAEHYIFGTEPNEFLKKNIEASPRGDVLCLAEGEGRNAIFLARRGYTVTAVDSSSVGLNKARKLAIENEVSVKFIHANLESYDLGQEKWSGIVSIFCHLPPTTRMELHRRIVAGLEAGGALLLEAYTPEQLKHGTGGPPSADLMMTAANLRKELEGLQFSHLVEIEREVLEGSHHSGIGAVVQAIAIKKQGS